MSPDGTGLPYAPPAPPALGAGGDPQAQLLQQQLLTNQLLAQAVAQLTALRAELAPHLAKLANVKIPKILGG